MGTVVGLFETRDQAQRAAEALRNAGYRPDDISIVMRDRRAAAEVAADVGAGDATAAGVVGGGLLGGLAGWLVGIGALAIPGVGPIIAAGPLAAALAGGAIGAAAGGLLGALVDAGIPEEEARYYQTGVERGGILMTVRTPAGREDEARRIMSTSGMRDLSYHRGLWERDPNFEYNINQADWRDLNESTADKTVGGGLAGGAAGAVIGGLVGGPVGAAAGAAIGGAAGTATGVAWDFAEAEAEFRSDWQTSPYRDRITWEQARPAYQYGWESYNRPEYRDRPFDEVRSELQRTWRGQGSWTDYEPLIRSGWERRRTWRSQSQTGMNRPGTTSGTRGTSS